MKLKMQTKNALSILVIVIALINQSIALRCFKCDSNVNENCATFTNTELESSDCSNINDSCQIIVGKDGNTIRGCTAEISFLIPEAIVFTACNSGDLCNGGIFPINRQQCHQCSGTTCVGLQNEDQKSACPIFNSSDECFVTVENKNLAHRGCVSSPSPGKVFCDAYPALCHKCSADGCNGMLGTSISAFRCTVCDSRTDSSCSLEQVAINAIRCQVSLLLHQETCYSATENGIVTRGCTADNSEVFTQCQSVNAACNFCNTTTCNDQKIDEDYCYECDSATDPRCLNRVEEVDYKQCAASPAGVTGCYRHEDGNIVRRGCASELLTTQCDGISCKTCLGLGCNRKAEFQTCFLCDSLNDLNCVFLTDPMRIEKRTCLDYLDTCRIWIPRTTLSTSRGCFKETDPVPCFSSTQDCRECEENNCNGIIYPIARPRCNQCSGASCADVAASDLLPCQRYQFQAECYSILDVTDVVHRGCIVDADAGADLCKANSNCVICGATDCNTNPIATPPTLSCIECGPSEICGWSQNTIGPVACTAMVALGSNESCFANTQNGITNRGCLLDNPNMITHCNDAANNCDRCTTSGCNQQNRIFQSCIKCRSSVTNQQTCGDTAEGFEPEECFQVFQEFEERGCYTMNDGVVIRGCISDLTSEEQTKCKDENDDSCHFCLENGCNVMQAPDSGTNLSLSFLLLLVSFVAIYY